MRYGAAFHGYRSRYEEQSLNRARFKFSSDPFLFETYVESRFQFDLPAGVGTSTLDRRRFADLEAGTRIQYFADGGCFRASPRMHLVFFPDAFLSAGLGYSRTFQYLYQLSFYNLTTSDIWVTATEEQKPVVSDHWSTGIYLRPSDRIFIQAEVYLKRQQNLRIHEINIQSVQVPLTAAPWNKKNKGLARGLELMF